MKIIRQDIKVLPEVFKEIKSKELELENLINKFRFFLITFLLATIFIVLHISHLINLKFYIIRIPVILSLYLLMYSHHRRTKQHKGFVWLKYLVVSGDYLVVFGLVLMGKASILQISGLTGQQFAILLSILFITINGLSALRVNFGVIIYSTCVALLLNGIIFHLWNGQLFAAVFTSIFIVVSGFLNIFISGFIFRSYVYNYQLNDSLKRLEEANRLISGKNEEINAQNNELETQNEYLHNQNEQIAEQKKQIVSSIEYASRIQNAVLDTTEEIREVAPESFIFFKPRDIVSGDFYWFKKVEVFTKKYNVFAAVDCTGHGVPGAFMSMLGTSFLNEIVTEFYTELDAAEILNRMREEIKKHLHQDDGNKMVKDGMDMALCAIDYDDMELQFAGANNPLYIIRCDDGTYADEVEEIIPDKMPIGIYVKEKVSFTNHKIKVSKDDLLYVFSDGFVDQFGGDTGDKFKRKRFKELLVQIAPLPMQEQKTILEQQLENWKGKKFNQVDDITIIGVKV